MSEARKSELTAVAEARGLVVWPSVKRGVAAVIARDPGIDSGAQGIGGEFPVREPFVIVALLSERGADPVYGPRPPRGVAGRVLLGEVLEVRSHVLLVAEGTSHSASLGRCESSRVSWLSL